MARLGIIEADVAGKIIRILAFAHELENHAAAPEVAETIVVALTESNVAKLQAIAQDVDAHSVVGGEVKKGAATVSFEEGDDDHTAAAFLHGLSTAQRNALRAGAKAVITGLDGSSTDEQKAIGYIAWRLMRFEGK